MLETGLGFYISRYMGAMDILLIGSQAWSASVLVMRELLSTLYGLFFLNGSITKFIIHQCWVRFYFISVNAQVRRHILLYVHASASQYSATLSDPPHASIPETLSVEHCDGFWHFVPLYCDRQEHDCWFWFCSQLSAMSLFNSCYLCYFTNFPKYWIILRLVFFKMNK